MPNEIGGYSHRKSLRDKPVTQAIAARDIDLEFLQETYGLQRERDRAFFPEWYDNLPSLSDLEQQLLDRLRESIDRLLDRPPALESTIGTVVVSPLLFIGGFSREPYEVRSEFPVTLAIPDDDRVVRGRIDTLVVCDRLWVAAIESKRLNFGVLAGLPQILAYMLANPNRERDTFGLVVTGDCFLFAKLAGNISGSDRPRYGLSKGFRPIDPGENALYDVLRVLKKIGGAIAPEKRA